MPFNQIKNEQAHEQPFPCLKASLQQYANRCRVQQAPSASEAEGCRRTLALLAEWKCVESPAGSLPVLFYATNRGDLKIDSQCINELEQKQHARPTTEI